MLFFVNSYVFKGKKKYIDLEPISQVDRNHNIHESVSIVG